MARLNKERQARLEPKRIAIAKERLVGLGLEIVEVNQTRIDFIFNSNKIQFFPYSGWHTGKGIVDGRGAQKLFKQLK